MMVTAGAAAEEAAAGVTEAGAAHEEANEEAAVAGAAGEEEAAVGVAGAAHEEADEEAAVAGAAGEEAAVAAADVAVEPGEAGEAREAREADDAGVPGEATRWGAETFCASARRRLRTRCLRPECRQEHVNFLLLGPAGVGKSSLIHTCWRALRPRESCENCDTLLAELQLGWSLDDAARQRREATGGARKDGGLKAKHGTTRFNSYAVQRRKGDGDEATAVASGAPSDDAELLFGAGDCGIYAQDTKGHQFFDEREHAFAKKLVDGCLKQGSTQERASLHYWALLSKVGLGSLFRKTEVAHCPSVVVLVFDVTLRSFAKMLKARDDDPQLDCYREIAAHARAQGLSCLAVLTHVDVLERRKEDDDDADDAGRADATASPRRVGEGLDGDLGVLKRDLAAALGADRTGAPLLPADHVYALVNYHVHKNDPDATVDLAALEFLAAMVDHGEAFLLKKRAKQDAACRLS